MINDININWSSLKRLTIVVPTYGRQRFIARQIQFWKDKGVSLIVLDGSPYPADIPIPNFFVGNFLYKHLTTSIEERLGESIKLIETDYVALLSDDEFFLPEALDRCIQFLDGNPSYSACKGQAIGFGWGKKKVYGFNVYSGLKGYEIVSESGCQRMVEHMSPYAMASLWSVQRKEVFSACMNAISSSCAFSSAAAGEMQVSLISAFMGNIRVIDDLMWLRSFENRNIWWENGNVSIYNWWRDMTKKSEHARFINSIVKHASGSEGLTPKENQVRMAMEAYCLGEARLGSRKRHRARQFVIEILPERSANFVKLIIDWARRLYVSANRFNRRSTISLLASESFPNQVTSIEEVEKLVAEFHSCKG